MSGLPNFSAGNGTRATTNVFAPVRGRNRAKSFVLVPEDGSCISMGMQHSIPKIFITEINLCGWIGQASPGAVLEYHRGFLTLDASPQGKRLSEEDRAELLRVARRAWWASEKGLVHLVQRRHGADDYSYLAIARPKAHAPSAPLSSVLLAEAA